MAEQRTFNPLVQGSTPWRPTQLGLRFIPWAIHAFAPGPHVPVLSGLSERRRGLAHDHGVLTAYLLLGLRGLSQRLTC